MRKEAEAHAAEDKKKVELIEARNQADQAVFQIEKLLQEHGDKLQAAATRTRSSRRSRRRKQAMSKEDVQAIKQATSDLAMAAQALAAARPGRRQPGRRLPGRRPGADGGGPKGGKDDVIDAEYEVKK